MILADYIPQEEFVKVLYSHAEYDKQNNVYKKYLIDVHIHHSKTIVKIKDLSLANLTNTFPYEFEISNKKYCMRSLDCDNDKLNNQIRLSICNIILKKHETGFTI